MSVRILVGDCRSRLSELPDRSVQCCVTSPPYFGLRDYGPATQIGLEGTPDEFVAALVGVFREVRRVLRDDGTLWLNLGDSYASAPGQATRGGAPSKSSTLEGNGQRGGGPKLAALPRVGKSGNKGSPGADIARRPYAPDLKPKDLIGIPWMVAFALRADGWWLRGDHVWAKPNGMPESTSDRPTRAHEYVFLLSKSASYAYDAEALRTAPKASTITRLQQNVAAPAGSVGNGGAKTNGPMKAVARKANDTPRGDGKRWNTAPGSDGFDGGVNGANLRSVWWIPPAQYSGNHYAVMPDLVAEICIRGGTPNGGVVVDPFAGVGTTGLISERLGRDSILIELAPRNAAAAQRRIKGALGSAVGADETQGLEPMPLFDGAAA